jgi:dTDP-4-amino-4,6-dideoxygalactose transaminase
MARRTEVAARYNAAFGDLPGVRPPREADWATHAWHLYVLRLDPDVIDRGRDGLIADLTANQIGSSVHFIPLHHHPAYREEGAEFADQLPETERYYRDAVSLPLFPAMSDDDVADVIEVVTSSVRRRTR